MAATDRRHGKNGQILMDPLGVGGAAALPVVSMQKWDLDMSTDKPKVTCFGDPNQVYVQGLPDIKGSYAGALDVSAAGLSIFGVIFGSVSPYLKLLPDSVQDPDIFWAGKGLLDGKVSVDVNGAITTGGSFVAAGPWVLPVAA
jgi:hypothetical protein